MEMLELALILIPVATLAGLVDSIAGGGGLLTIPALLWCGLPPLESLATNKAQAVFGSGTATIRFAREGIVDPRAAWLAITATFAGAALGALAVQRIDAGVLASLIPTLLIAFAIYFWFSPRISDLDSHQRMNMQAFSLLIGLGIGFYDGFFGPGTGTFFVIGYVALLGYNLRRATGHAKLLNFTSNLVALLLFIPGGHILWGIAALMAIGQLAGAWIGSHMVLRHGTALVRPVLVAVSLIMSATLLWQRFAGA